jgi:hypothetical protein
MQTRITAIQANLADAEVELSRWQERVANHRSRLAAARDDKPFEEAMVCGGCGLRLHSELEFSQHYHVTDRRYPNLGECPVMEALKAHVADSDYRAERHGYRCQGDACAWDEGTAMDATPDAVRVIWCHTHQVVYPL